MAKKAAKKKAGKFSKFQVDPRGPAPAAAVPDEDVSVERSPSPHVEPSSPSQDDGQGGAPVVRQEPAPAPEPQDIQSILAQENRTLAGSVSAPVNTHRTTIMMSFEAADQLEMLRLKLRRERGRTLTRNDLYLKALDLLFQRHGMAPVAVPGETLKSDSTES